MTEKPPSQRRVGARIRVKPEHTNAVAAQFSAAKFEPIYIERRADGDISFWFDKAVARDPAFIEVVQAIPLELWAIRAVVGSPIFH